MSNKEEKILVALGTPQIPGHDTPTIILGMTPQAWAKLENGGTHDFDFGKVGIPMKLMIIRGESHADLVDTMQCAADSMGAPFVDSRGTGNLPDLGIDKPRSN